MILLRWLHRLLNRKEPQFVPLHLRPWKQATYRMVALHMAAATNPGELT